MALGFWKKANDVVNPTHKKRGVVVMPTGVGKTTQAPQALYQSGMTRNSLIFVSVPKRVLAVELAAFEPSGGEYRGSIPDVAGMIVRGRTKKEADTALRKMMAARHIPIKRAARKE